MPKASKETASESVEVEGYKGHFEYGPAPTRFGRAS